MTHCTRYFLVACLLTALASPSFAQVPADNAAQNEPQSGPRSGPQRAQIEEAIRSQLPPPPAGFKWQLFRNAVFPRPEGWNERTVEPKAGAIPVSVYAASPEPFSESKQFEMGVTLQIISGSQALKGIPARKAALLYLKPFLDAHKREDFLILDTKPSGDFERTVARYRDAPPGLKPVIVHKFILANDGADSVHIFTFESPEDTWQENWDRFGTPILAKVNVLPGVPSR